MRRTVGRKRGAFFGVGPASGIFFLLGFLSSSLFCFCLVRLSDPIFPFNGANQRVVFFFFFFLLFLSSSSLLLLGGIVVVSISRRRAGVAGVEGVHGGAGKANE